MTNHPFHQLAVMKKVAQTDRKVIDYYRCIYKKALWDEAAKEIVLRHQIKRDNVSQFMIEQLIQELGSNTLPLTILKQNTPVMNELLQQVILLVLSSIFDEAHDRMNQAQNRHAIIHSIHKQKDKMHILMTGSFSKDIQHSIHPLFHEKIVDKRFVHLIKVLLAQLDKQADKYFLSKDLLRFVREVFYQKFDSWIKEHDKGVCYQRYKQDFFIGIKHRGLDVKQFTQRIKQFTHKQNLNLQRLQAQPAKKGIHFLGYKIYLHPSKIHVQCDIPNQSIQQFIQDHGYGEWQTFTSASRPYLLHLPEEKIIRVYNRELSLFAGQYKLATDFHRLRPVLYLAQRSLLQTIARKRNSTPKKIKKRLARQQTGHIRLITYPRLKKLSKKIN